MNEIDIIRIATYAAIGAGAGVLGTRWLLNDTSEMHALLDPRLDPEAPPLRTSKLGATRALLQGFVHSLRETMTEAEVKAMCPVLVTEGHVLNWSSGTIELMEPIDAWLIRYEGGPTAIATTNVGVRLLLEAVPRPERGTKHTMLAMVRTADGSWHLIHAAARTATATSRYETTGFGPFRRHRRIGNRAVQGRRLYKSFQAIGGC